jgi:hypothetical protein
VFITLQAWSSSWKLLKKKRSKKGSAGSASLKDQSVEAAWGAVAAMQVTLHELLTAVAGGCKQLLLQPQATKLEQLQLGVMEERDATTSGSSGAGGGVMEGLIGWQQELPVQVIVKELVEEQGQVVEEVQHCALQLVARIEKLHWL